MIMPEETDNKTVTLSQWRDISYSEVEQPGLRAGPVKIFRYRGKSFFAPRGYKTVEQYDDYFKQEITRIDDSLDKKPYVGSEK